MTDKERKKGGRGGGGRKKTEVTERFEVTEKENEEEPFITEQKTVVHTNEHKGWWKINHGIKEQQEKTKTGHTFHTIERKWNQKEIKLNNKYNDKGQYKVNTK